MNDLSATVPNRPGTGIKTVMISLAMVFCAGLASAEEQVGNFGPPANGALPFTIEFVEVKPLKGTPPALHSHRVAATLDGDWLLVGGRGGPADEVLGSNPAVPQSGLHGFNPPAAKAPNFPLKSYNRHIWVYNPVSGETHSFDTDQLPVELARPLQSTSQQSWYDRGSNILTLVGGYGWNADNSDLVTHDTMIQVDVSDLIPAIKAGVDAKTIGAMFQILHDPLLQVTGGELVKVGSDFFLMLGQNFNGQYFAFGVGLPSGTTQEYTEEVRQITMVPGAFKILNIAKLSMDDRSELHRRDLNIDMAIDATTGEHRIGIYGGVFKEGGPGGFEMPIFFDPKNGSFSVQTKGRQIFNAYATSVVSVWSDSASVMSQVFFGGIGHGVYNTHGEVLGLDNDGMPFGSDISVLTHSRDGTWAEWVLEDPVPGNQLLAANSVFVPAPDLQKNGVIPDDNIIRVDQLPNPPLKTLVGRIYGGIWAAMPQPPKHVEQGDEVPTHATNQIFEVYITRTPGSAIPVCVTVCQ